MLSWRLKLREAEESFKQGRLDAAERLLRQHQLLSYRKGQKLAERLANAFAERATRMASGGAVEDAWRDLARAKSLDARPDILSQTEDKLIEAGLTRVRECLHNDELEQAQSLLADLELLGLNDRRLERYRRAVQYVANAEALAQSGRFVDAEDKIDAAREQVPDLKAFVNRRSRIREQGLRCRQTTGELQAALTAQQWERALETADSLLEQVPKYKPARDARRRAMDELAKMKAPVPMTIGASAGSSGHGETSGEATDMSSDTTEDSQYGASSTRFILWVDGVGGFLTCLDSTLSIGQAVPDSTADIPIQGDISAQHAVLRRVGDDYLVDPKATVLINETPLREPTLLSDGDEIQLDAVVLRFRRPHALSASARLDFVSRHRTHPWTDAIILMAESCVLGPSKRNHILCRDWRDDIVLFRQDGELFCRAMEPLEIDGVLHDSSAPVKANSRVAGEDFSMTFEPF